MKKALVITSIGKVNAALKQFAEACQKKHVDFYIIGDTKSPQDFHLDHCDYWSIHRQAQLPFSLAKNLPTGSYVRKNLGYLLAMQNGAEIIFESDDDNFPMDNFFQDKSLYVDTHALENQGWVNVYQYFSHENVWPRGFPLTELKKPVPTMQNFPKQKTCCPIQQGLADKDPDVDAIYRLTLPLPIHFHEAPAMAFGQNTWCPFNTQSTLYFEPAFPLLYIPTTCNFRVTDIWRSFIATRILWANDWSVLFTGATVYQERNKHDLLWDFEDEIKGYLHNKRICETLANLDLKSGTEHLEENLFRCYKAMVSLELIAPQELHLLENWFNDIAIAKEKQKLRA
ncbi:MAG TPA: STELLO glycosyltransferase family protein [Gammaproteobacteria bacterium]|jgi:hypothetical protein|nr:STELLO glycosyltransferase family protein [Gammaproteobacteria bacterium]